MEERPRIINENEDQLASIEAAEKTELVENEPQSDEAQEKELTATKKDPVKGVKNVLESVFSRNGEAKPEKENPKRLNMREAEIKIVHKENTKNEHLADKAESTVEKKSEADIDEIDESDFDKRHEVMGNEDKGQDIIGDPETTASMSEPTLLGSILASKLSLGELDRTEIANQNGQIQKRAPDNPTGPHYKQAMKMGFMVGLILVIIVGLILGLTVLL